MGCSEHQAFLSKCVIARGTEGSAGCDVERGDQIHFESLVFISLTSPMSEKRSGGLPASVSKQNPALTTKQRGVVSDGSAGYLAGKGAVKGLAWPQPAASVLPGSEPVRSFRNAWPPSA